MLVFFESRARIRVMGRFGIAPLDVDWIAIVQGSFHVMFQCNQSWKFLHQLDFRFKC